MIIDGSRRCLHCNRVLRKVRNAKARYCTDSCKVMAYQQRKARRERLPVASEAIEVSAPPAARSYRLGIRRDGRGPLCFFGPFGLHPFEAPRVPVMGVYLIEYFDAGLGSLQTPDSLSTGIFIKTPDPKSHF